MLPDQLPSSVVAEPAAHLVRWQRLLLLLLAVSGAIVALSLFLPRGFTYVSEEANLPAWWTGLLLVGAAGLHLQAGILARRSGSRGAVSWWLLAALLAMLSLDEIAGLHERLQELVLTLTDTSFAAAWVVLGIPIAIAGTVVTLVLARRLPRRSTLLAVGGIGLLLASAVGLEAVGGLILADQPILSRGSDLGYLLVMHLEEFGEMAGAALAACSPLAALPLEGVGTKFGVYLAAS